MKVHVHYRVPVVAVVEIDDDDTVTIDRVVVVDEEIQLDPSRPPTLEMGTEAPPEVAERARAMAEGDGADGCEWPSWEFGF